MDVKSEECGTSELDLFSVPPTQVAIEDGKWVQINPREVNDSYSIKFEYSAGDGLYLDLAKSYLSFKAKIDGTTATLNKAGPVNNWAHSVFKQIDLEVNGTIITTSNAFYAYEAMLAFLLNYGKGATESQLELCGFKKDTAGQMDVAALDGDNEGLTKRAEGFNTGSYRDFIMRPNIFLFLQERLLPPSSKISLNLVPSDPKFCLMVNADTGPYKPKFKDLKLHMRVVKVNSSLALEHAKNRMENNMKLYYPLRRLKTKPITIPRGLQSHTEIISMGQMPKREYVMLVSESAQIGNFKKNPFNFQHFNLNEIYLSSGINHYPSMPLTPDFTSGRVREAYMTLFSSAGILFDDKGLDITLNDYKNGYTIFAFDLTADNNDGDHMELVKRGDVQLHVKFSQALAETVTIICIAEYENTLQIDKFNTVIKDYMN